MHASSGDMDRCPLEYERGRRAGRLTAFVFGTDELTRSVPAWATAEGAETEGQRKFLEKEGCCAYQGYLFGPR